MRLLNFLRFWPSRIRALEDPPPATIDAAQHDPVPPHQVYEATCATCGVEVSDQVYAFCVADAGRFGGLVYCYEHQREFRSPAE